METSIYLANRLREVILSGTWIANTNYKDQLDGLDWTTANTKINNLNTIADLAQHVHYYILGIKQAFLTSKLNVSDKFSFDFKPFTSQEDWDVFLQKFWADTEDLARLIDELQKEKLSDFFFDKKYGTYLRNIDGMIEHSYYHLAQIVLLIKITQ